MDIEFFIACSDLIASKLCSHSAPRKIKHILWEQGLPAMQATRS
ncbi:hypothetical protein AK973_1501 [Pseudomonas brassicacearum]|nr:hypothetical protein AK973_1501 [Pseudomonas brassicacearum]